MNLRPARHVKLSEAGDRQGSRKLTRAVGPEVEKDNGIAILYCCYRLVISSNDNRRLNKLVSNSPVIEFSDRCNRLGNSFALALHQQIVGAFSSLPMLVSIHCVIPSDD